jgi:hypothetical protein
MLLLLGRERAAVGAQPDERPALRAWRGIDQALCSILPRQAPVSTP